jgi:CRP-like cAMP-binding protein
MAKKSAFDPKKYLANVNGGRNLAKYRKGAVIFSQGEPANAVFYIHKGKVKIVATSDQGKATSFLFCTVGAALALGSLLAFPAHAVTISISAGTTSSVAGAVPFQNFDGTANASIGTVTGGTINEFLSTNPLPDPTNHYMVADPTVTVTLTQPASYVGFLVGTADAPNTVTVMDGATTLTSFSMTSLLASLTNGFLNITAGPGEVITEIIETNHPPGQPDHCCFETDNYAAILTSPAPVPLPGALPLFATGLGVLGLLGWRRKRKAQAAA